jgi:hypothetical protein
MMVFAVFGEPLEMGVPKQLGSRHEQNVEDGHDAPL